jgi:hypothetical protein
MRMPKYTDEQKRKRKHTINVRKRLNILDSYAPPTPQGITRHHPRAFMNKPLKCQSGLHQWGNGILMGIPHLICKKCGDMVATGIYNHTETKREIRTRHITDEPEKTNKQMIEEAFEVLNRNPRR